MPAVLGTIPQCLVASTATGGMADSPSSTMPHTPETSDLEDQRWHLRMFRAGVLATLFFQVAYLLQALQDGGGGILTSDLHLSLVGLPIIAFALTWWPRFQRYCRQIAMAMSVMVIVGMAALSVVSREIRPLFVVSILTLAGTGLLPWSEYWQGILSASVLASFAVAEALISSDDPYEFLMWLGLLTGMGIAQAAVRLSSRHRRAQILHFEELKSAQARSSQSEATIRQMLDAIPGLVFSPGCVTASCSRSTRNSSNAPDTAKSRCFPVRPAISASMHAPRTGRHSPAL